MIQHFPKVLAKLAHESYTITKGEAVTSIGVQSDIEIIEPQPLTSQELQRLDAGERASDWRVTWTSANVSVTDEIEFGGAKYRVMVVTKRDEDAMFCRVTMRAKNEYVA